MRARIKEFPEHMKGAENCENEPEGVGPKQVDGKHDTVLREIRSSRAAPGKAASRGPHPTVRVPAATLRVRLGQAGVMFSAVGPFWPCAMSKVTFWPS
jgi:hypothetical protein